MPPDAVVKVVPSDSYTLPVVVPEDKDESVPYSNEIITIGVKFGLIVPFNVAVVVPTELAANVVDVGFEAIPAVVNERMSP